MDFVTAYENHVWPVYGYLAYRTTTREEAEDLTQLTFERALKAWARFDPTRASARTWLLTIARNALIDEHRRTRPEPVADVEEVRARAPALVVEGPEASIPGVHPELEAALGRLQQREREVLALRYGADLTAAEIAGLLELTVANVHQISSRGLRKLRVELAGRDDDATSAPG